MKIYFYIFLDNSVHIQENSNTFKNPETTVKTQIFWDDILQPFKNSLQIKESNQENIKKSIFIY